MKVLTVVRVVTEPRFWEKAVDGKSERHWSVKSADGQSVMEVRGLGDAPQVKFGDTMLVLGTVRAYERQLFIDVEEVRLTDQEPDLMLLGLMAEVTT